MFAKSLRPIVAAALIISACSHSGSESASSAANPAAPPAPNTLTSAEKKAGWKLLFDGKTLTGWRGYQMTTMPEGWMVMDGTLMKMKSTEDIVTTSTFGDFEFSIDWKVELRGNAGIFYRATEEYPRVYWSAPEYQVAEDSLTPDSRNPLTSAGAVYGFYPGATDPSLRGINHRAGEWNTTKIVAKGNHVEHWLNGKMIAQYEAWSPDFTAKYEKSKFKTWAKSDANTKKTENFARAKSGLIAIQGDHNGQLSLRNIKIRELK